MDEIAQTPSGPLIDTSKPVDATSAEPRRVDLRFDLLPGATVEVVVETRAPDGSVLEQRSMLLSNPPRVAGALPARPDWLRQTLDWGQALAKSNLAARWQTWLFGAAVLVYLLTRLVGLSEFPIYFFTDEAVQMVRAADLVRDHFFGYSKEFLPTFFTNGNQYNLSTSVYLQLIPYLLFDRSVWATRVVAALATLLAAFSVGRILKDIYASPYAWAGVLLLSSAPAWLLHSRTAFETALATSFYAGFLWLYLLYRCKSPRYLYAAVGLGALAFYTYSPMQMIVLVTAVLLLLSDARYHWQQRGMVLRGFGLALLLALPYARFLINHPNENLRHLEILSSYWVQDISLEQKLASFGREYLRGLDPMYWFLSNDTDLARHRFGAASHMLGFCLPLAYWGLVLAVKNIRLAPNCVILAAFLAFPTGAALVGVGITRLLAGVIPLVLLSALGLSALLRGFERLRLPRAVLALTVFALLAGYNLVQLQDALVNGPTWFHDYGLGGMQYGARQVFPVVEAAAAADPQRKYLLSPSWANGTEEVARFFVGDKRSFGMGSIEGYMVDQNAELAQTTFVMLPEELKLASASGKFQDMTVDRVLLYPDGTPGFYFLRMQYSRQFEAMLAAEKKNRVRLREDVLVWEGQPTRVRYSTPDMGQIKDALDGNPQTVLRTLEANPLRLDIRPETALMASGIGVRVGGSPQQVTLRLRVSGRAQPLVYRQTVTETPQPRVLRFNLGQPLALEQIDVEVLSIHDGEPAHVHVWEVSLWK